MIWEKSRTLLCVFQNLVWAANVDASNTLIVWNYQRYASFQKKVKFTKLIVI